MFLYFFASLKLSPDILNLIEKVFFASYCYPYIFRILAALLLYPVRLVCAVTFNMSSGQWTL